MEFDKNNSPGTGFICPVIEPAYQTVVESKAKMHRAYLTLNLLKVDKSEAEKNPKPSRQNEVLSTLLQGIFFFTNVTLRIDTCCPLSIIGS